jgi:uncharacterized membrane protein HdeD (DUF308 family)
LEGWKIKRKTWEVTTPNHKTSGKDYYQILTSALMVILGAIILFRTLAHSVIIMPILVGGGLLALGIYRLSFVLKYFKERKKWHHR